MKNRYYPLNFHMTSLFLTLTVIIGAVLIAVSYNHSKALLQQSAQDQSLEHSSKLELLFQESISRVLTTVNFMAITTFFDEKKNIEAAKPWLTAIALVFEQTPNLVALYYATDDGHFVQYRPLTGQAFRKQYNMPAHAAFMIISSAANGESHYLFLDKQQNLIEEYKAQDTPFDPRVRPWFTNVKADGEIRMTKPYPFHFLNSMGVTLSRRSANQRFVIGADFTLQSLSQQLGLLPFYKTTQIALFDQSYQLIAAYPASDMASLTSDQQKAALQTSVFAESIARPYTNNTTEFLHHWDNQDWAITTSPVNLTKETQLILVEATPINTILADLLDLRNKQLFVAFVLLLICLFLIWFIANRLSKPLQVLVKQTENIARFNFRKTRYPKSVIREVSNLTKSIEIMEHTLHDLLHLLRDTAGNQDFDILAKTVAKQAYMITHAETILLCMRTEQSSAMEVVANHSIIPFKLDIDQFIQETPWLSGKLKAGEVIHMDRSSNTLKAHQDTIFNSDLYVFPLHNRMTDFIGILIIGYERSITPEQQDKHDFLKELLGFAEIAKDNIDKIAQQKQMLNAFVELIASAIDTKSPYTGAHCQRIPMLAKWLTQATDKDNKYFPQFSMSEQQWEELNLAAWLHDCGKVTTPEYVVDKATKLETIYDRIHEVRMRFELLKTQADADYWQGLSQGGDAAQLSQQRQETKQQLDDDFYFIAQCNKGSEYMQAEDIERLHSIAQRQWQRTLDDRAGVSWIEQERHNDNPTLPVMESVLADKQQHQIPWDSDSLPNINWQNEYQIKPGALKYNRGELYNLSTQSGTLTTEERFIINNHIIQTQIMLSHLPYPDNLSNIPEIAGNHHERMDGKGYPKGKIGEELSIPARVMAIADVFEALTSSDRPYKKGKTLAESLDIMTDMATSGHIDPKLYLIFLLNDIHLRYINKFVDVNQHSQVDKQPHIDKVKKYMRKGF